MFDLKRLREHLKYDTEFEFAQALDIDVDFIYNLERNPDQITEEFLKKVAKITDMTIVEIVEKLQKKSTDTTLSNLLSNTDDRYYYDMFREFRTVVDQRLRKPRVAFFGLSDAGKSTLINTLIEKKIMKALYTPTTSISVYIKHINDKPEFVEGNVCIIRSSKNGSEIWNPNKISDYGYMKNWLYQCGEIDLLSEYGTRDDNMDDEEFDSAIIFLDSEILNKCDLIDLPGYNTGDREQDDTIAVSMVKNVDIAVYMSVANGGLRGNEIKFFEDNLNDLPIYESQTNGVEPFGNVFILASQAHAVNRANQKDLKKILDEGAKRLYSCIQGSTLSDRSEITSIDYELKDLRNRFFAYSSDVDELKQKFVEELVKSIERYHIRLKESILDVTNIISDNKSRLMTNGIKEYSDIYIDFADKCLERHLIDKLGIEGRGVLPEDIEKIERIEYRGEPNHKISTLLDFIQFKNLKELILPENNIMDISPLAEMGNIEIIDLCKNERIFNIDALTWLSNLKELRLASNNISAIDCVNTIDTLEMLDVSYNKLVDVEFTGELENLKYVNLSNNSIEDINGVNHLIRLEYLDLRVNKIDSLDVEECSSLDCLYLDPDLIQGLSIDSLKYFSLTDKNFSFPVVKFEDFQLQRQISDVLYGNEKYEVLEDDLWQFEEIICNFSDGEYVFKYRMINSEELCVSKIHGSEKITSIEGFQFLVNLSHLELENHVLSDVSHLSELNNLVYLNLCNNKIANSHWLCNLVNLVVLYLNNNNLREIDYIAPLKKLRRVALNQNYLVDLNSFKDLELIEALGLIGNQIVSLEPIIHLNKLKKLYVSNNRIIHVNVLKNIKTLDSLHINNNNWKDSSELVDIYDQLENKDFRIIYYNNMLIEIIEKHGDISGDYSESIVNNIMQFYESNRAFVSLKKCLYQNGFGNRLINQTEFIRKISNKNCVFKECTSEYIVHNYDNTWFTRNSDLGFTLTTTNLYYTGKISTSVDRISISDINEINIDSDYGTIRINNRVPIYIEQMPLDYRRKFYPYFVELIHLLKSV